MKYRRSERTSTRRPGDPRLGSRSGVATSHVPKPGLVATRSRLSAVLAVVLVALGIGAVPTASHAGQLPEGYAYELATPLWTHGQRALPTAVHPDGQTLLFGSAGGFAGTENLMQVGIEYVAHRTAAGWETRPLAPAGSAFPYLGQSGVKDYTDDFTRTLWIGNATADAGTNRFTPFVRESDGTFRPAGPVIDDVTGTNTLVGTSADLSTVVFRSKDRPALTDGTTDTRATSRESLLVAISQSDGSIATRQVAFRAGGTMFPTCALRLGGANGTAGTSGLHAVSADGQRIFFTTSGLPSCVAAANNRVWMKDGTNEPVDLAATQCTVNCGTPQRAAFAGAARDGSRAYFTTEQKLVDGDQDTTAKSDLYEYDLEGAGNQLIPVTPSVATDGAGVLGVVRVSNDGARVYFVANGRPLAGANVHGDAPQLGQPNLYVYHRPSSDAAGTMKFVGTLAAADSDLWSADVRRRIQVSDTGQIAFFVSAANLAQDRLPGDNFPDVFRFDAESGDLRRLWPDDPNHNGAARSAGVPDIGKMTANNDNGSLQSNSNRTGLYRQFSEGGTSFVFSTQERLSAEDVNDAADVYLWQADGNRFFLLSSGRGIQPSEPGQMTPSGDTITLTSADPLVPEHTSGSVASYVVRRGGGFAPSPPPPVPCQRESCQGPLPDLPGVRPGVGTGVFVGPGNPAPEVSPPVTLRVTGSRRSRSSRLRLSVRVSGPGDVRVQGKRVRLAKRSVSKAETYKVSVSLNKAARRAFAQNKRVRTTLRVSFKAKSGKSVVRRYAVSFQRGSRTSAASEKAKGGR